MKRVHKLSINDLKGKIIFEYYDEFKDTRYQVIEQDDVLYLAIHQDSEILIFQLDQSELDEMKDFVNNL